MQVSTQTVRNRLHDRGLNARRPYIVFPLTARHRWNWARQYQRWNLGQWSHVMFSDESRFITSVMVDKGFGGAGGAIF